jgi:arylsulfatase
MQDLWWAEAARNDNLPLDWRAVERLSAELTGKPSLAAGRQRFVYETPLAALPEASAPDLKNKSFAITAEAEIPTGGADGMIFTQGGFTGGWAFDAQQGRLVGLHSYVALERYRIVSTEPVPTGEVTLAMDSSTTAAAWPRAAQSRCSPTARRSAKAGSNRRRPSNTRSSKDRTSARTPARRSTSATPRRSSSMASLERSRWS